MRMLNVDTRWNEAELRTYTFLDEDDELASLHETQESLSARGKDSGNDGSVKLNKPEKRSEGKSG